MAKKVNYPKKMRVKSERIRAQRAEDAKMRQDLDEADLLAGARSPGVARQNESIEDDQKFTPFLMTGLPTGLVDVAAMKLSDDMTGMEMTMTLPFAHRVQFSDCTVSEPPWTAEVRRF